MSRFAYSVLASRREQDGLRTMNRNVHRVGVIEATSGYEARGIALAISQKIFPAREGWYGHSVGACSVDDVETLETAISGEFV